VGVGRLRGFASAAIRETQGIRQSATALALTLVLGGCAVASVSHPDGAPSAAVSYVSVGKVRAPDATGAIEAVHLSERPVSIAFQPNPGFEHFVGTTFEVPPAPSLTAKTA
jgi:hypothetical protein